MYKRQTHAATQQSIKAYVDAELLGVTAGNLSLASKTTDDLAEGSSNLYYQDERVDDRVAALIVGGANITATYNDGANTLTIDADNVGDVTGVTAGSGMTGGGSSGDLTLNVIGGDGITAAADEITVDSTVVRTSGSQTIAGAKTFSNDAVFNGNLTVNGTQTVVNTETLTVDDNIIVLNNNEAGTPSQDAGIEVERGTSTNVKLQFDEGTDKWQFTNDGSTYNDILTVTQVEALLSVTDSGGDGSLTYDNTTGVFTYTGPSAAEVRAHISVTDAGGDGSAAYNSSTCLLYTSDAADE